MIKDPTTMFCAVRLDKDSGREWLDTTTLSGLQDVTASKARRIDKQISDWATVNPVQRIARVEIQEIKEA